MDIQELIGLEATSIHYPRVSDHFIIPRPIVDLGDEIQIESHHIIKKQILSVEKQEKRVEILMMNGVTIHLLIV